jgi:hypothetical protein
MRVIKHFAVIGGIALAVAAAAIIALPHAAKGDEPSKSLKECFRDSDIRNWVAPDPRTLYFRVYTNRYYRVDLANECSPLRTHSAHLIMHSFGPDLICAPVDLNIRASEGFGDIPEPCFVKGITRLSADEAAALPKNAKP